MRDETDTPSLVASYPAALSGGGSLSPQQSFMAHLRMVEWVHRSNYVSMLSPVLDGLVRRAWTRIVSDQRALLLMPALTVRAIEAALASDRSGLAFAADLLLAAEPAVSVNLASEFRELLRTIRNG